MDSRTIEMRLRLPAPEEPAVLPSLVLPVVDRLGRAAPNVRMRRIGAAPSGNRLVYAVVGLVLLMLSVIIAGALRVIDNPFDPKPFERSGLGCTEAFGFENHCFTMTWPEGWQEEAAGSIFPGDFTETGIAYERVHLVVASVPFAACASPGGPFPTSYESGGVNYQPRETADPALACLRTAELPPGAIRVSAEIGNRSRGLLADDGPAIQDTSEPSLEAGWTEQIDGRPARLTIATDTNPAGTMIESRTWDILLPGTIDQILRVRAEIAGPDLTKGRADVESVLAALRFEVEPVPLDEGTRAAVLRSTLDDLDREIRQSGSDFYGCFPRDAGARTATISSGLTTPLPEPVEVTCRTAIEPSAAGLWRVTLEMSWPAGRGYRAGGRIDEIFVDGSGKRVGTFSWLHDRSPVPLDGDEVAILPMARPELPPLLTGPLNLPVGSIVEMLYPGQYPEYEPNAANEALAPQLVGWHLAIVSGPRIVGGDEWYEVQTPDHFTTEVLWARGTFHGRPMLAPIEPSCPPEPIDVGRLASLPAYEQLACLDAATVALSPVIAAPISLPEPESCMFEGPEPTTCPLSVGSPAWLTSDARQQLFGSGGPQGVGPGLRIWLDPALGSLPSGVWLRVHGHVDDPAATSCSWTSTSPQFLGVPPPAVQIAVCRARFVVTDFEPVAAP